MAEAFEPATLQDLPDIVDVFFSAFNGEAMANIFPPTPAGREFMRQLYEKCIKSEPGNQTTKVFVVRDDHGKAVSTAVYYMIGAEDGGLWPWPKRMPTSLPDSTSAGKFDAFFGKMAIQHEATMKDEPHVFLEILGTHEDHRKKGHGSLLVNVGNHIADELDQACYLDAAEGAAHLYESLGYVKSPHSAEAGPWAMKRAKKSERV